MITCKNCKWRNAEVGPAYWCHFVNTDDDDYCSWAEPGKSYQIDACSIFDDRHNYVELGPLVGSEEE